MKKIIQYTGFAIVAIIVVVIVGILALAESDKKLETLLPLYTSKESKFLPVLGMQVHYTIVHSFPTRRSSDDRKSVV